jgi:hypothetical protein
MNPFSQSRFQTLLASEDLTRENLIHGLRETELPS